MAVFYPDLEQEVLIGVESSISKLSQMCSLVVCVCVCTRLVNHAGLFVIPWTVAHQAPLSMEFSKQKC